MLSFNHQPATCQATKKPSGRITWGGQSCTGARALGGFAGLSKRLRRLVSLESTQ